MVTTEKRHVAKTLKQCIAYVVRDCDEAGFHDAAYYLRRAMEEFEKEEDTGAMPSAVANS